jgi:hypothetical protein
MNVTTEGRVPEYDQDLGRPAASTSSIEQYFEAEARVKELRTHAIRELVAQREKQEAAIEQIDQQLAAAGYQAPQANGHATAVHVNSISITRGPKRKASAPSATGKRGPMSEETKAKMRASQKLRWSLAKKAAKKK